MFVYAGSNNFGHVDTYLDYKRRYHTFLGIPASLKSQYEVRTTNRMWDDNDVGDLVSMRCQPNPPTYANIAFALNRSNARLGVQMDRPFTATCCNNKWLNMFPASQDVNRAVQYVRDLQKNWSELYFRTETEISDEEGPPKLLALHIVWP